MTMLELDETTAREYCEFMIDGELDELEVSVHDLITDIERDVAIEDRWYFSGKYDEVINKYGLDGVVTIPRDFLEDTLNAAN